jgi:hypothetical protein
MSLKRILKLLAAFFMSQGVSVVKQLQVPLLFLHHCMLGDTSRLVGCRQ